MSDMTSVIHPYGITMLDRVRPILPEIEAREDEIEQGGRVLLGKLEVAGAFRICLPRMFGGEELTQSDACQVIEEVSKADA